MIDSGKEKQKNFNPVTHISSLQTQWISKASAKQRSGRAGRLCNGFVFRMYSRDRYNYLIENQKPEFLRCDLTDVCLQAKMIAHPGMSITDFLMKAITPPSDITIQHSIEILQQLGAMQFDQSLTQLGFYLADIPLNAKYGKMLIYGILFKCIDPILTIVSILSINEPFTLPYRQEDRERLLKVKQKFEEESFSDHFVLLRVFQKWNEYKTRNEFDGGFCEDNYINPGTMERIASTRHKIVGFLRSVRLIQSVGNISALNEYSHNWSVIKACIAAGSYPEVARILKMKGDIVTPVDSKLIINPGSILRQSINTKLSKAHLSKFPSEWIIFDEKNLIAGLGMARVCTLASNVCIALTAGLGLTINDEVWLDDKKDSEDINVELAVDKFIKFSTSSSIAYVLQDIRQRISVLMNQFLMDVDKFVFKENDEILIGAVVKLFELEDEKTGFKINYNGVGSRPRVVTRDYNQQQRSPKDAEEESKENIPIPSISQRRNTEGSFKNVKKPQPKYQPPANMMRYFMVELKTDISPLKLKTTVSMKADAKLPDNFIDALIEMEVNDQVSKKVIVFYSGSEIIGVGMLMKCREKQMTSEIMKMFFQSKQRFNISELK